MLFNDHAINRAFYGDYEDYFSSNTDHEGVEYLMLVRSPIVPPRVEPFQAN